MYHLSSVKMGAHTIYMGYAEKGNGTPLLFLHGLGSSSVSFQKAIFPLLPDFIRAIAIDFPGFGHSSSLLHYSIEIYENAIRALLDHLAISSAHIYGMSMGGTIALTFAARHPECVRTISVQGAPIRGSYNGAFEFSVIMPWFIGMQVANTSLAAWQFEQLYRREDIRRLCQHDFFRTIIVTDLSRSSPRALWQMGWQLVQPEFDLGSLLEKIRCPVFLIDGDRVEMPYLDTLLWLKASLPHAEVLCVPNAGHLATYVAPQIITPALVDFVQRHE